MDDVQNVQIVCVWCQKEGVKRYSLCMGAELKSFCSEKCFAACRRAYFKRNKVGGKRNTYTIPHFETKLLALSCHFVGEMLEILISIWWWMVYRCRFMWVQLIPHTLVLYIRQFLSIVSLSIHRKLTKWSGFWQVNRLSETNTFDLVMSQMMV